MEQETKITGNTPGDSKFWHILMFILGVGLSLFTLLDYGLGLTAAIPKRATVLAFCLAMVLIKPLKEGAHRKVSWVVGVILAILGVGSCIYASVFWWDMAMRPTLPNTADISGHSLE